MGAASCKVQILLHTIALRLPESRPAQNPFLQLTAHVSCAQTGICCVGAASLLAGEGSASHPISQWQMLGGMALIILSQVHSLERFHVL